MSNINKYINDLREAAREVGIARLRLGVSPGPEAERLLAQAEERENVAAALLRAGFAIPQLESYEQWKAITGNWVSPWLPEGLPSQWRRVELLTNRVIAMVDPFVGGYQDDPHSPSCIGWKVEVGTRTDHGILMLDADPTPSAIRIATQECMRRCDEFLFSQGMKLLEGGGK